MSFRGSKVVLEPITPATRGARGVRRGVRWFLLDPERNRVTPIDVVFLVLSALTSLYMLTDFEEIQLLRSLGLDSGDTIVEVYPFLELPVQAVSALGIPLDEVSYAFVLGALGVLLVLEATRRTLGVYLMGIVGLFIVYARFGYLIPGDAPVVGVLGRIQQTGWADIIQNLWYNTANGVFGVPVQVSVQFIYIFILFGAFLEMSGAGKWFIDLAYAATGRRKGGPAKASILASGFMGMISGSSIANTVTTGAFTIPLMKRTGYRPEFAGGVEASASSGGQILPPVMGAAAFLIVEYHRYSFRRRDRRCAGPRSRLLLRGLGDGPPRGLADGLGGVDPSELVGGRVAPPAGLVLPPAARLAALLPHRRATDGRALGVVHPRRHRGAGRAGRGLQPAHALAAARRHRGPRRRRVRRPPRGRHGYRRRGDRRGRRGDGTGGGRGGGRGRPRLDRHRRERDHPARPPPVRRAAA